MPVTPNFAIPYPDGTTSLTPLQDKFADIANAVDSAMLTGLAGAPRLATSDAQRASIFPAPVQGNLVDRPDKGYIEEYLALYNASTNPSGAISAGWYPLPGTMLGSSFVTATNALTTSAVTIPGLSAVAYTPATPVLIRANIVVQSISTNGNDRPVSMSIWEDGVAVNAVRGFLVPFLTSTNVFTTVSMTYVKTPTAGAHTYTVKAQSNAASVNNTVDSSIEVIALAPKV